MPENSAKSAWSELWLKEDYWAIRLGFPLLTVGCILFLPNPPQGLESKIQEANATMDREATRAPFKTIAYYKAQDIKAGLRARNFAIGKQIAAFFKQPQTWKNNPVNAFFLGSEKVKLSNEAALPNFEVAKKFTADTLIEAQLAQDAAAAAGFQDQTLNKQPKPKLTPGTRPKATSPRHVGKPTRSPSI